ncbi:HesA/MoeB/ThiF family protein [Algoriphagus halophytocola]|uniref:HesA/MoeB/ThiF family protein n=1 Tax=Algoriphagus halophytocola TaxID=2991499 RepID=UPI0022DD804A|nr:HesA/MoeB/ThiF family protein [Algoriphagus sp. TR-M9]WBL42705.1 HesA/MoeB/ThiF family protein [Algoriphagus sp. TR-M9]
MQRYQRQIILPGIRDSGQQKLHESKILVVGAGGLGCAVLPYLAAAGVGNLGIVDGDKVELSNLHRQVLYSDQSTGSYKVQEAKRYINHLNSAVKTVSYPVFLTEENVDNLISAYDLVIDATDNTEVRYILDEACRRANKPMIYGSIFRFQGQVSVFNYQGGPSYRSLFPEEEQSLLNCAEAGVLGTTVGLIGMLQANEAMKIVLGIGEVLSGKILIYNLLSNEQQIFDLEMPEGEVVERVPTVKVDFISPEEALAQSGILLDVREIGEVPFLQFTNCINLPLSALERRLDEIPRDRPISVFCQAGTRAIAASKILQEAKFSEVKAIRGGAKDLIQLKTQSTQHEKSIS